MVSRQLLSALALLVGLLLPACSHAESAPDESPTETPADRNYTPTDQQNASRASSSASRSSSPQIRVIERNTDSDDDNADEVDPSELSTSELESRARKRELGGRNYPLHDIPRKVKGEVKCPDVEVVEYAGSVIPYNQTIEIIPRFRSRLVRFEKIVRDVALEVYGRTPDRIVHLGGHNCRTVGGKGEKLSEHAFGHAIDVKGFDFEALPNPKSHDGPNRAAKAFEVRLADHWNARLGFAAKHRKFLRRLAAELTYRGPFSAMLGPSFPGHDEIFHFDFGPQFFFRL